MERWLCGGITIAPYFLWFRYWVPILFWPLVYGWVAKQMNLFVEKLIDQRAKQEIWFEYGCKFGSSVVLL